MLLADKIVAVTGASRGIGRGSQPYAVLRSSPGQTRYPLQFVGAFANFP